MMSKNKKPLIIVGINVSKCCYVIDYDPPEGQGTWGGAIHKGACRVYSKDCKDNPNCYFKQLARKTQELETICKAFDIEYGYDEETGAIVGRCNKLIEKEKVLEEYKQSLNEKNKFLQDLGISASGEFKRIRFYIENLILNFLLIKDCYK